MGTRTLPFLLFISLLSLTVWFLAPATAATRPPFPDLTGPVVDQAGLLSASTRDQLAGELRGYAKDTSNQVVVVTLKTLDGYPIDEYGYQLGRHWGIGQKGKDNGALLLVDYDEHKLRIEVGYGLEGTLTDALSSNIIRNVIVPRFKDGKYEEGIVAGTHAILKALGGNYQPVQEQQRSRRGSPLNLILMLLVFGAGFLPMMFSRFGRGGMFWGGYYGGMGGGLRGGGFGGLGGGGFGGGGGSFGGGGASGGW